MTNQANPIQSNQTKTIFKKSTSHRIKNLTILGNLSKYFESGFDDIKVSQYTVIVLTAVIDRPTPRRTTLKKNPLRNLYVMLRLNPYAKSLRRQQQLLEQRRKREKQAIADKQRGAV